MRTESLRHTAANIDISHQNTPALICMMSPRDQGKLHVQTKKEQGIGMPRLFSDATVTNEAMHQKGKLGLISLVYLHCTE